MHMLGRANWWMPARLARRIPELNVEGRPQDHLVPNRADLAVVAPSFNRL
jgi:RND superfamily putative drug exporter